MVESVQPCINCEDCVWSYIVGNYDCNYMMCDLFREAVSPMDTCEFAEREES